MKAGDLDPELCIALDADAPVEWATPVIVRIDLALGHVKGNVAVVSYAGARLMEEWTAEQRRLALQSPQGRA